LVSLNSAAVATRSRSILTIAARFKPGADRATGRRYGSQQTGGQSRGHTAGAFLGITWAGAIGDMGHPAEYPIAIRPATGCPE